MPESLSDAQLIERLERVERNLRRLAERVGVDFVEAQRVVNSL
jgi:hypothetical protein